MSKIDSYLTGAKAIAISGHVRPDGDCIGSCLAMYLYVKKLNPEWIVDVLLEEIPDTFKYIKGADLVNSKYDSDIPYDIFISLDCGDKERLGKALPYFESAKKTISIDHHISNAGFADIRVLIPEASSTCEVIFDLMEEKLLDEDIACALYTGIIHDTGVFQYSNTSQKTMNIAGKLMNYGIPFSTIIQESFYQKSYVQNQILGRTLLESIMFMNGKCIVSSVTKKVMDLYNVVPSDLEGIVSQLKNTSGVECAIFIYEMSPLVFKVSMRSNRTVDVSKIAAYFGGGGHVRAAGCTMMGTVHDVINNLSRFIEKQLQQENEN